MTTYITQEQAIELAESTTLLGCDFSDFEAAIHRTCNAAIQHYRDSLVAGVVLPPFAGVVDKYRNVWTPDGQEPLYDGAKIYTADQLRQAIADALAKQVPQYLCNSTRFKLSLDEDGKVNCFWSFKDELDGRWVALVAAENDCHLSATTGGKPL